MTHAVDGGSLLDPELSVDLSFTSQSPNKESVDQSHLSNNNDSSDDTENDDVRIEKDCFPVEPDAGSNQSSLLDHTKSLIRTIVPALFGKKTPNIRKGKRTRTQRDRHFEESKALRLVS